MKINTNSITSIASILRSLKGRNFLSIDELSNEELGGLLDLSKHYKKIYNISSTLSKPKPLTNHSISMIFQKRSTRTRVSTETGMSLLGGQALILNSNDIQLGVNESIRDTALVLSRFNSLLLARVYDHKDIVDLASHATVPVINALSDLHHPLQTLADLMTLEEHFGEVRGKTLAWVGDGTNVIHDLMLGSVKMGMNVRIATPRGYECNSQIMAKTNELVKQNGVDEMFITTVAEEAVKGSDIIVTDTWVSMGQEDKYAKRLQDFAGYEVNVDLLKKANPGAVFLHCLPRHRDEVTDEVFYSDSSLVFAEAENRMWTVMAVIAAQIGKL